MPTKTAVKEPPTAVSPKIEQSLMVSSKNLKSIVDALAVKSNEECQAARAILSRVIGVRKRAMEFVLPILANAKEGLKLAKQQEQSIIGPLDELEANIRVKINRYLTEVEMERRKQEEEEAEKQRVYQEKLERSRRPERVKAPAPLPVEEVIEAPVLEDTAVPMVAKYEIENEELIPDIYFRKVLDRDKLWKEIREAHKEGKDISIPGVKIWEEAQLTIRR